MPNKRIVWIVGSMVVALVVLVTAGTFVYLNFIKEDAPPPLVLDDPPATTSASSDDRSSDPASPLTGAIAGSWAATSGSQAGYRVQEILFGQSAEAVGRTSEVTGTMTIDGTTVTAVNVSVDMASVTSDEGRRDNQFRGRIMDTATYPTATFALTEPIVLATVPADSTPAQVSAAGDLTLHGTTRAVQTDLSARRNGPNIEVSGAIPVTFADYGIPNPSFGPAKTEDHGLLELLVVFVPAS